MGRSNAAHEPSMEEILASIRKIIESSDERPGEGALQPRAAMPDFGQRGSVPAPVVSDLRGTAAADLRSPIEIVAADHPAPESGQPADVEAAPVSRTPDPRSVAPLTAEAADDFFDLDFSDLKIDLEREFAADVPAVHADARRVEAQAKDDAPAPASLPVVSQPAPPRPTFDADRRGGGEAWANRSDGRHAALRAAATVAVDRQAAAMPRFEALTAAAPVATATATVEAEPLSSALPQALRPANSDDPRMSEFRAAIIEDAGRLPAAIGPQLLSERSGERVGASFEELTRAIREGQLRSMEEMAEDLMRPMLQEWLDDNLPKLVERLVREEIERVARGGR